LRFPVPGGIIVDNSVAKVIELLIIRHINKQAISA
jgi:hypothetical protein